LAVRESLARAALIVTTVLAAVATADRGDARAAETLPVPIAHWTLDDDGPEARDSAGGHHGTIKGATPHEGRIGGARLFVRSRGDVITVPYAADFDRPSFTVSAWVWLTNDPTFSGIVGTRAGGDFTFDMKVNTDKVHGDIGDGTRWIETKVNFYADDVGTTGQGGDLETRRWYLVTFVVDDAAKQCRLYLDGDRKKTIPFQGTPTLMRPGRTLTIGDTGRGECMDGVIDDVRIWGEPLTDAQVATLAAE
jgi:hypothetical protein